MILLIALILFVYPFALYPAILFLLGRMRPDHSAARLAPVHSPTAAMVVCALNEEKIIGEKLKNVLSLEYPKDRLRIVVVSDGSTDRTAEIARQFVTAGVELIEQPARRGKIANMNEVISRRREDIIVSTDANVLFHPMALLNVIRPFLDPTIGCVSAKIVVSNTLDVLKAPEESYFSLEWFMQQQASRLYSMAGVDGAMYAFRRELFRQCPNDTIIEDFVISMSIVRQGKRVVFEPVALGWESGPTSVAQEFQRRVRIAAGAAQALLRGNGWPRKTPWRFVFVFTSHKLLRWFSPLIGLVALLTAAWSWNEPLSKLILAGFSALSGAAILRIVSGWRHPLLDGPFYFLLGQVSLGLGLLKGATGTQSVLWRKADR